MKILCIKSVVMSISREVAFSKGKTYEATIEPWGIEATNNDDGQPHQVFDAGESCIANWDWFVEHFI